MRDQLSLPGLLKRGHLRETLDWFERVHLPQVAKGTRAHYLQNLGYLKNHFCQGAADPALTEITYEALWTYVKHVAETCKMSTAKQRLVPLKIALEEAVKRGLLAHLPPWPDPPGDYEPRERYLTREEYDRLRLKLVHKRRLWLDVCLWTGMHKADVQALTWGDVNLANGTWQRWNRKNHARPIWVPMPDELRAVLSAEHARLRGRTIGLIVVHWAATWRDLGKACRELGIPPVAPIDLRRTLATWWLEAGGSRESLKTYLGHSKDSPMVERIYGRTTPTMMADALTCLNSRAKKNTR